jgi:hypothetical protein
MESALRSRAINFSRLRTKKLKPASNNVKINVAGFEAEKLSEKYLHSRKKKIENGQVKRKNMKHIPTQNYLSAAVCKKVTETGAQQKCNRPCNIRT